MKIILLKNIAKLGKKYDVKDVSSGHAINMLIPQGLAIEATVSAIKNMNMRRSAEEGEVRVQTDLMLKNIVDLQDVTLEIAGKANEKGHLFAGIHREEIVKELAKQHNLIIDPSFIVLDQPIKEVGEHEITVSGGGKTAKFKLNITSIEK
ncbi:MAG: 50S ribosomal protein L9 [Candidatus Paceibacterota bacterium]|jgi:large subunit ribosomal protein L9